MKMILIFTGTLLLVGSALLLLALAWCTLQDRKKAKRRAKHYGKK